MRPRIKLGGILATEHPSDKMEAKPTTLVNPILARASIFAVHQSRRSSNKFRIRILYLKYNFKNSRH